MSAFIYMYVYYNGFINVFNKCRRKEIAMNIVMEIERVDGCSRRSVSDCESNNRTVH